jgi:hypothetical protein
MAPDPVMQFQTIITGSSREQTSGQRVNSEAAALNTPNEKIVRVPSDKQLVPGHRLTNGTGPVSSSKQPSHTGSSPDPLDPNGHPKKKKKPKPWSREEDMELGAGVQKHGEGNWMEILHKYKFDSSRTHLQLQQVRSPCQLHTSTHHCALFILIRLYGITIPEVAQLMVTCIATIL